MLLFFHTLSSTRPLRIWTRNEISAMKWYFPFCSLIVNVCCKNVTSVSGLFWTIVGSCLVGLEKRKILRLSACISHVLSRRLLSAACERVRLIRLSFAWYVRSLFQLCAILIYNGFIATSHSRRVVIDYEGHKSCRRSSTGGCNVFAITGKHFRWRRRQSCC